MKKIIVVMPAKNCEKTLEKTFKNIPKKLPAEIILVDNNSKDFTVKIAKELGITVYKHEKDKGYGGSQKTLYQKALDKKADIIVMIHPDYQYDAGRLPQLIKPIIDGKKDLMFGSRMVSKDGALKGGMPLIKFVLNRFFCLIENVCLGVNFTEHFSGMRAYSKKTLEILPFNNYSNDYVFDQHLMISAIAYGFRIGEIPIPTRYFSKASSIKFLKGSKFLLETLIALFLFILYKSKIYTSPIFKYN